MEYIIGLFSEDCGAGYYSSRQEGSRGSEHIKMYFDGRERDERIPFSYWESSTPVCDEYHKNGYIEYTYE